MLGMTIVEPGLRERKRLATRHAIQMAAIELAFERGVDGATVDEISRRADVSARTFFNYFPSKEAALIGELPVLPPRERLDEFVNAGPGSVLLDDLGALVAGATDELMSDSVLNRERIALLKRHAELFAMRMGAMREFEDELRVVVAERLVRDEPDIAADPDRVDSRSRLITLIAFGAIRHAWACWSERGAGVTLRERITESFAELHSLIATGPAR